MTFVLEMLAAAVAIMKMAHATRTQRLLAGLGVLLLVDIIWVASSEVSKVLMNHILSSYLILTRASPKLNLWICPSL